MTGDHGENGAAHREGVHERVHGRDGGERSVARGTTTSISGTSFVLTTGQGELIVTTSADTTFHSPRRTGEARESGYADLAFAILKVGQSVAVQGERGDDAVLAAEHVHIPKA